MSNDEDIKDKRENKFAEAAAQIAHSPMGYYIGFGLFALAIGIGSKWDGHLFDQKGCVDIKKSKINILKLIRVLAKLKKFK